MLFSIVIPLFAAGTAFAVPLEKRVTCPTGQTTANAACCKFFPLRDDLQNFVFDNVCGEDVHEILRLSFHDAIGFSASGALKGHGADGSLIVFQSTELGFHANTGLDDSVDTLSPFLANHTSVSAGDMIQFAAALGITNCPGAPKLTFMAGRPAPSIPASDLTVPEPSDSVDKILARVQDAGLTSQDMVNLLISHTIARADDIDPTLIQVPFDTTPFTFDTQFFLETLLTGTGFPGTTNNTGEVATATAKQRTMRLESDFAFAHDPRTACQWQLFINNQNLMMASFKTSMNKMAVLGQNVNNLIDCSDVIPNPVAPLNKAATYPPGLSKANVQQSCNQFAFPTLATQPGAATVVPLCPDGTNTC